MRADIFVPIWRWVDSHAGDSLPADSVEAGRIDWLRVAPFIVLHLACLAVLWVGWSWTAVWVAVGLYWLRMFGITAFYHRYFSHRSFRTSRFLQFVFAVVANMSAQRGPLWWASHHRHHHRLADTPEDVHSPRQHGILWSHMGWFLTKGSFKADLSVVKGWLRYPELVFLDRFDVLAPVFLLAVLYGAGEWLAVRRPGLGTDGMQLVVWGGFISTVVTIHATLTINSLSHVFGRQRFRTEDDSRNNALLALLTLGEGWHNNHHHYPVACRQGIYWWEMDITYYVLKLMSWVGLVWDVHAVPAEVIARDRADRSG